MKKKGIIIGVVIVVLLAVIVGVLLLNKKSDKNSESNEPYLITLDINPSIEFEVRGDNVNRINPQDKEAEGLITREFEGKSIKEVLDEIIKNAIDKAYVEQDSLTVIIGMSEEDKDKKTFEDVLREVCDKNKVSVNVIIPEITEEARHEAQGYGVSPAKAQVILDALEKAKDLSFDDLKGKSARELVEMKETGLYCGREYTLRGDVCERVIKEEKAKEGEMCPSGYVEYNGKCYEEAKAEGND